MHFLFVGSLRATLIHGSKHVGTSTVVTTGNTTHPARLARPAFSHIATDVPCPHVPETPLAVDVAVVRLLALGAQLVHVVAEALLARPPVHTDAVRLSKAPGQFLLQLVALCASVSALPRQMPRTTRPIAVKLASERRCSMPSITPVEPRGLP